MSFFGRNVMFVVDYQFHLMNEKKLARGRGIFRLELACARYMTWDSLFCRSKYPVFLDNYITSRTYHNAPPKLFIQELELFFSVLHASNCIYKYIESTQKIVFASKLGTPKITMTDIFCFPSLFIFPQSPYVPLVKCRYIFTKFDHTL